MICKRDLSLAALVLELSNKPTRGNQRVSEIGLFSLGLDARRWKTGKDEHVPSPPLPTSPGLPRCWNFCWLIVRPMIRDQSSAFEQRQLHSP